MQQLLKDTSNVFSRKASRVELLTPRDFRNDKRAIQLKLHPALLKYIMGMWKCSIQISCMQNLEPLSSQARLLHPVHLFLTGLFV